MDEQDLDRIVDRVLERLKEEGDPARLAEELTEERRRVEILVNNVQQRLAQVLQEVRQGEARMQRRLSRNERRAEDTQRGLRRVLLELRALVQHLRRQEAVSWDGFQPGDTGGRGLMIDLWGDEALQTEFGVLLHRSNSDQPPPERVVDCLERREMCRSACCYLGFPLTWEEVQKGVVEWEPLRPFWIRQNELGYCVHWDPERRQCGVYADRPVVCRAYTCARDRRIWSDFANRVLSPRFRKRLAWLEARLQDGGSSPDEGTMLVSEAEEEGDQTP